MLMPQRDDNARKPDPYRLDREDADSRTYPDRYFCFPRMTPSAIRPLPSPSRLAVVEDDSELRECIMLPALRDAGFDAIGLATALQFYRMWASEPFDLVLLDVGLPDDDGVEIARHLRGLSSSMGIVVYTGHGHVVDRMRGLRAGVDAYLSKPLDMEEVIETLRNVQRRQRDRDDSAAQTVGWSLGRHGWCLLTPSGGIVTLNQAERQIMGLLAASPSRPVARDTLIAALTSDVDDFDPHRLEMLIYRLRRKCLKASGEALPLQVVRGIGYMFGR
jgi:DNA-binding response OmpR family regulator